MSAPSTAFSPRLTALEAREVPAVAAVFNTSVLTVVGDANPNDITVAADAAGNLTVTDAGAPVFIRVTAGSPTKTNLTFVSVSGRAGNDTITLDRSLNVLGADSKLAAAPAGQLDGNGGNDTIRAFTGGFLGGVIGNPIVGNLVMQGGAGDDFLDSGFGNDLMLGGDGNDTMRWLPGTLIDTYEGGPGTDTGVVVGNGNGQGDAFVLAANPDGSGRVLFQRTNLVPFFIDIGTTERVSLQTADGNDTITVGNLAGTAVRRVTADGGTGDDVIDGSGTTVALELFGGDGNDTVTGGTAADVLFGGIGDDILSGGAGADSLFGGHGHDRLAGGRGRDVLSGDDGDDVLDDGVKDGQQDVLSGGAGADQFVRRRTNTSTTSPAFDELALDVNAADGDAVKFLPV